MLLNYNQSDPRRVTAYWGWFPRARPRTYHTLPTGKLKPCELFADALLDYYFLHSTRSYPNSGQVGPMVGPEVLVEIPLSFVGAKMYTHLAESVAPARSLRAPFITPFHSQPVRRATGARSHRSVACPCTRKPRPFLDTLIAQPQAVAC